MERETRRNLQRDTHSIGYINIGYFPLTNAEDPDDAQGRDHSANIQKPPGTDAEVRKMMTQTTELLSPTI